VRRKIFVYFFKIYKESEAMKPDSDSYSPSLGKNYFHFKAMYFDSLSSEIYTKLSLGHFMIIVPVLPSSASTA